MSEEPDLTAEFACADELYDRVMEASNADDMDSRFVWMLLAERLMATVALWDRRDGDDGKRAIVDMSDSAVELYLDLARDEETVPDGETIQ